MPDITITQGQQLQFSLPVSQGALSNVTLALDGTQTYPVTAGTLQTGDSAVQEYTWPDTAALPLGTYTYTYTWSLNGTPESPITGTLTISAAPTSIDPFTLMVQALAVEVDAASEPVISNDDLAAILRKNQVARTWTPNTYYEAGERILPTSSFGYWYYVIQPGTSGTTEPFWPNPVTVYGAYNVYPGTTYYAAFYPVTDGTVVLHCDGKAAAPYNLKAAARAAWRLKAARAAALVDTTLGTDKFAWSQVYKNCMDQAGANVSYSIA